MIHKSAQEVNNEKFETRRAHAISKEERASDNQV
jgi:hypothetical protein